MYSCIYNKRAVFLLILKHISFTMVQSFSYEEPILLLVLFENLDMDISGRFSKITLLIFHNIDKKLPYFRYFERKFEKLSFYKDDQKKKKNGSNC